eukprot:6183857-Pleurochrysis_carterae.AAC.2
MKSCVASEGGGRAMSQKSRRWDCAHDADHGDQASGRTGRRRGGIVGVKGAVRAFDSSTGVGHMHIFRLDRGLQRRDHLRLVRDIQH